jgi:hypothetical protein
MTMAWIEAHDTLPDNPKVLRAAKALHLDSDALVGKLLRLWTWALSNREDGVLSDLDAGVLHRIMNYGGKADKLLAALTEVRLLDALPDGRYAIHDWDEHVAMLMEQRDRKRAQARERQRRRRAASAAPEERDVTPEAPHRSAPEERDKDAPCHAAVTRDTSVTQPASVTRDVTHDVTPCHAVTVPNRTVPYRDDPIDDPAVYPARVRAREAACGVDNLLAQEIEETVREGFVRRVGRAPTEAELSALCALTGPGGMPSDMTLLALEQALTYGATSVAGYACKTLLSWQHRSLLTPEAVRAWEAERAGETAAAP